LSLRSPDHRPPLRRPTIIVISALTPSTIAASMTWPSPVRCACSSALTMPKAQ
jgi:hypothetical protein